MEIGSGDYGLVSVSRSEEQPDLGPDAQVIQIVADVCHLLLTEVSSGTDSGDDSSFVIGFQMKLFKGKFLRAALKRFGKPSRDAAARKAGFMPEADSQAISGGEELDVQSATAKNYPAVGQHSITIEKKKLYVKAAF